MTDAHLVLDCESQSDLQALPSLSPLGTTAVSMKSSLVTDLHKLGIPLPDTTLTWLFRFEVDLKDPGAAKALHSSNKVGCVF